MSQVIDISQGQDPESSPERNSALLQSAEKAIQAMKIDRSHRARLPDRTLAG